MRTQKNDSAGEKKSRVKVSKLQVNKETVEDLTDKEAAQIKGGGYATATDPTNIQRLTFPSGFAGLCQPNPIVVTTKYNA